MLQDLGIYPFLVREFGGYAVMETDNVDDVQMLTATFAVFRLRLEPVLDIMDAVAVEAESIA